jgi:protein-S-isoprenylcysteine O-methyltransferase Ste14
VVNDSLGWALVGTQFGVIAALIVFPGGDLWQRTLVTGVVAGVLIVAGVVVAVLGGVRLGRSLTPVPRPKDDGVLVTTGIYSWVRHPIYTGVLLAGLGLLVWGASIAHLVGWAMLWAVLNVKASIEEKMLSERYGEYGSYAEVTGRLLPRWPKPRL